MDMQHHFRQPITLLGILALLVGSSCQGPASSSDESTDRTETIQPDAEVSPAVTTCYLYTHGQDSVHLVLIDDKDTVSGTLHFRNHQIDGSQGTVHGRFRGDTLFVLYEFQAEGTHNITEEAFLKRGGTLIRGFGDRSPSEEVYRFTDHGAIDFSEGQVFQPVSCTKKE
ncbi:hypothetical protein GCM10007415_13910 [Parapedobacter pyrenivorans]|uniref:Uncharacterized protein n=2 Tax=Parapedobacter pyrenivorans TaxID=1305674 RepID=A0A917M7F9_9SPHI|nr:hypothetical protein GCM10007415_13910 [Parapedobacter pyrenivorans]